MVMRQSRKEAGYLFTMASLDFLKCVSYFIPRGGDRVFKDECLLCYDSPVCILLVTCSYQQSSNHTIAYHISSVEKLDRPTHFFKKRTVILLNLDFLTHTPKLSLRFS